MSELIDSVEALFADGTDVSIDHKHADYVIILHHALDRSTAFPVGKRAGI